MPTFDIQAMVRGYHVYQHVWDASIHEELPCAREADNLRDPQIWHERVLLERALLEDPATQTLDTVHPLTET